MLLLRPDAGVLSHNTHPGLSSNCHHTITQPSCTLRKLFAMITSPDLLVESFSAQPSSLRIAVVTETFPPEVNGVAMTLGRLVGGLVQRGHTVQLVRPRQSRENAAPGLNGVEEILSAGVPIPTYADLRFGMPSKRRLIKLWSAKRPDIVHVATEGPLGWSAVAAARKLQLPITSSFHTNFQSYTRHYGLGLLKAPIDSYLRKLHNHTLATMVPTRALLQDLHNRGYKNLRLLSRGVDFGQFSPTKRSTELRAQWGASPDDLVVLLVGRLAKEKNVGLVISAFRAIQRVKPTAKLVFVGDGPLREALQSTCPDAIFAGVQKGDKLAMHYASADLFLFPSLTETFGNVVPEALASGLAVVSYANAAAQELITSGHNGLLVALDDEFQFIQTAVQLTQNPQALQALRQVACASVARQSWDAIYDTFVDHLHNAIHRAGGDFHSAQTLDAAPSVTQASA